MARMNSEQRVTLVGAALALAMVQLDVFVVNVAVRQIGASLGGGTAGLQWLVSAYTLVLAALILTAGAAGDRLGARRVLIMGFVVFTVASVACATAPSLGVLIGARAVQGGGAALLGACSLALVNHAFSDPVQRAHAVGLWSASAAVALAAGPVVGGVLIELSGWRAVFLINVPLGALGWWLTRRTGETDLSGRGIDPPGQVLAVVAMTAGTFGLIEGGERGWTDSVVIVALALGVTALAGFLFVESRVAEPMLPLELFTRRRFAAAAFLGLLVNIAFYGLIFDFSLFFQRVQGFSAMRTGLAFLPPTGVIFLANLAATRLAARFGARPVILSGLLAMTLGCAELLAVGPGTAYLAVAGPWILLAGGLGTVVPPMTAGLMAAVERNRSGVASGTLSTMRQTGSVLGVAVFGSLLGPATHFTRGLHEAVAVSIVLALAAMAVALPMPSARQVRSREVPGPQQSCRQS